MVDRRLRFTVERKHYLHVYVLPSGINAIARQLQENVCQFRVA